MNNAADKSTIAVIVRRTDIPDDERLSLVQTIRDPSCRRAMQAYLGQIEYSQLNAQEQQNYFEIDRWSTNGGNRIKNEEQWHRLNGKQSKFAAHLKSQHQKGHVGAKLLDSTGVGGRMRKRHPPMSPEEKQRYRQWTDRNREQVASFMLHDNGSELVYREFIVSQIDWRQEGF